MNSLRKTIEAGRLAILTQFEYRFNLFVDAILQPVLNAIFEVAIWYAVFQVTGRTSLIGFDRAHYLVYALWGAFFSRVAVNWMYEFRMIEEIYSGRVNAILVRPISYYEYFLGQFMGYKLLTCVISLLLPLGLCLLIPTPTILHRLPLALALLVYYMVFTYTLSFLVASLAFYFNRIHSLTVIKNMTLSILSGELFPLDLFPVGLRNIFTVLPFSCGVYVPVGYLTGRLDIQAVGQGFLRVTVSLVVVGLLAIWAWDGGRRVYSGTGA